MSKPSASFGSAVFQYGFCFPPAFSRTTCKTAQCKTCIRFLPVREKQRRCVMKKDDKKTSPLSVQPQRLWMVKKRWHLLSRSLTRRCRRISPMMASSATNSVAPPQASDTQSKPPSCLPHRQRKVMMFSAIQNGGKKIPTISSARIPCDVLA